MARIRLRHRRFWAAVRVPKALVDQYGGKAELWRNLQTSDVTTANVEAAAWEAMLRMEWQEKQGTPTDDPSALRRVYTELRRQAAAGAFVVHQGGDDPVEAGIEHELERMADADPDPEADLAPGEAIRVAALQDALADLRGQKVPRRKELEPAFSEVAADFMAQWRTQRGLKETNTEQQKESTYRLFKGFWGDKPLRGVREADASRFYDALRCTHRDWARSPGSNEMTWAEVQAKFGGQTESLADGTMNRHMAALKALWDWAARRGHCSGHNPFQGFHRKLRMGVNVHDYRAWERAELEALFAKPPKRADVREVILVGMLSGMRLNEIASLRWDQLREDAGVRYFQVEDAKTQAGNRQVPLHPSLSWLWERRPSTGTGSVWPTFNPEGPGKKAGADAGKEFSRFKSARGFTDRRKAFHSFRKNVTRIMERATVPENEWAQVFGHEKGFTYGRYNPDGITLARKQEIIGLIEYPGVVLPSPGG